MPTSEFPEPLILSLFGKRVFTGIIKDTEIILDKPGCALNAIVSVLTTEAGVDLRHIGKGNVKTAERDWVHSQGMMSYKKQEVRKSNP